MFVVGRLDEPTQCNMTEQRYRIAYYEWTDLTVVIVIVVSIITGDNPILLPKFSLGLKFELDALKFDVMSRWSYLRKTTSNILAY